MKTGATIAQRYTEHFPESARLYDRARRLFPNGVTHDGRFLEPFPIAVKSASGAIKTSVEGRPIIDYWVGHGALLHGHSFEPVVSAVQRQAALGTHYAANHELEIEWAELIQRLIPSAERIRFTSSGTEATLMAMRLSRLITGRSKIMKLMGHFHGWHDLLVPGAYAPYDPQNLSMPGITPGVLSDLVVVEPNDLTALEQALQSHQPACLILEPTGGHWGAVPLQPGYLRQVRELTTRLGVFLIFDEVITGFRVAPGGAQSAVDVIPDFTALAKILAGGLPGGALVGRADLMDALAFGNHYGRKMRHPGTYNANPVSAAAGCAALRTLADGAACQRATQAAAMLRRELNQLFSARGVNWMAYGAHSMVHLVPNYDGPRPAEGDDSFVPYQGACQQLDGPRDTRLLHAFRAALLVGGADWFSWGGMTSSAHGPAELDATLSAFSTAIDLLRQDGWIV